VRQRLTDYLMSRNMPRVPTSKLILLSGRKPESHNWRNSRGRSGGYKSDAVLTLLREDNAHV